MAAAIARVSEIQSKSWSWWWFNWLSEAWTILGSLSRYWFGFLLLRSKTVSFLNFLAFNFLRVVVWFRCINCLWWCGVIYDFISLTCALISWMIRSDFVGFDLLYLPMMKRCDKIGFEILNQLWFRCMTWTDLRWLRSFPFLIWFDLYGYGKLFKSI